MKATLGFVDAHSETTPLRFLMKGQFYRVTGGAGIGTMKGALVSRIERDLYAVWSLQLNSMLFQTYSFKEMETANLVEFKLAKKVAFEIDTEVAV